MSSLKYFNKTLLSVSLASILLAGCATSTKPSENLVNLRQQLTQLQGESQLAMQAPLEIKEAEQAVVLAEKPEKNNQLAEHRVVMAERK